MAVNSRVDASTKATGAGNLPTGGNSTVTGNVSVNGTGNQSSGGTLQVNSGYGSVATAYGVRAWVNFNGTGTVAIREDGNVSSITDNGTGVYSINFATAMPDANYCVVGSNIGSVHASYACHVCADNAANTTSSCDIELRNSTDNSIYDQPSINVIVCR